MGVNYGKKYTNVGRDDPGKPRNITPTLAVIRGTPGVRPLHLKNSGRILNPPLRFTHIYVKFLFFRLP